MTGPAVPGEATRAGIDLAARRRLVQRAAASELTGIDMVEVLSNAPRSPGHEPLVPRRRTLLVRFLRAPVPGGLRVEPGTARPTVRVLGGVRADPRLNPVRVDWAYPAIDLCGAGGTPPVADLPGVRAADRSLVSTACADADRPRTLAVRTNSPGDWSTYTLALHGPGGTGIPPGIDPPLARAPFRFSVDCPSDLDCRPTTPPCPPDTIGSPLPDYLARDYPALRTRLLDRLATLLPGWTDRNPADPLVTLVELFAATGDRLAAWQDAIDAEAYLGTARLRTSVRRHTRLLDHHLHEGCSARVWLAFTTDTTRTLPAGTPVAVPSPSGSATSAMSAADVVLAGGVVFETCAAAVLRPGRNQLALHSWGDTEHCLPTGATSAFVARAPADPDPQLAAGDVVVLSALGDDPARGHAVRLTRAPVTHTDPLSERSVVLELHWSAADALTVPLPVTERAPDGGPRVVAVAQANVVLADHGATLADTPLDPPQVPVGVAYRPRLRHGSPAPVDPPPSGPRSAPASAAALLAPDPQRAVPQLTLDDGARTWHARDDLLASGRLDPHVVVETEPGRSAGLRFGDGVTGRRPTAGATMTATYRIGGGRAGNVGPDVLTELLAAPGGQVPEGLTVTNPLPAVGGLDPQPAAEAKQVAPQTFRTQRRAVTDADYAAVAMADPAVQRAVARRRWTGSVHTHEVTVDAMAGYEGGPAELRELAAVLEARRTAGGDVDLAAPVYVPLEIVIGVCVRSGHDPADVSPALTDVFTAGRRAGGGLGFFHPDNVTFGRSLYVSDVVAAAMAVPGVAWVDVGDDASGLRFRRAGRPGDAAVRAGRIDAAPREVLRADSDPDRPENGRFAVLIRGRT